MSGTNECVLFAADEFIILDTWFTYEQSEQQGYTVPPAQLRLRYLQENSTNFGAIVDATAAHVLLQAVRGILPVAGGSSCPRGIVSSRTDGPERSKTQTVVLFPRRLFSVRWINESYGSCHTTYYVTWVPHYERFVIISYGTCAQSRNEYREFALGQLTRDGLDIEGIAPMIEHHWKRLRNHYGQRRWKSVDTTQFVGEEIASVWANNVWPNVAPESNLRRSSLSHNVSAAQNASLPVTSNTHRTVLRNDYGEQVTKKGELLLTYLQLRLLSIIKDVPDNYFRSVNAWILQAEALPPGVTCIRQSIDSIPRSIVEQRDVENRYSCHLTERGKNILENDVPIRVRGIGSFSGYKSWSNIDTSKQIDAPS
jgi:hypothetical protein